jgi:pimeloyl-ACP methyl ester carboxylesterase
MLALAALAAFAVIGGGASAGARVASSFSACSQGAPLLCGKVTVPLNSHRAGDGTVALSVQVLPAPGSIGNTPRNVMFLLAGGPGQASVETYDLRDAGSIWQSVFPGYTLVTYDDRGTGSSGKISCPGIDAIITANAAAGTRIVAKCGRHLGARSSDYSTLANANDMDAVRRAIGADKVSIFGASYGTKQALGYAVAYPSHVGKLVLDSVVAPSWPDAFYSASLRKLPDALDQICQDRCQGVTTNAGADFVKLANRLAAHPYFATVPDPAGHPMKIRLDGYAMIELGIDTDLVPGIAAELPAAVKAGLAGDPAPLERLAAIDDASSAAPGPASVNITDNIAVDCSDGRFFWTPKTPLAERQAALRKALSHLTPAEIGPFGNWVALGGTAQACVDWPVSKAPTVLPDGPWPNVPVLILSGSRDIRTPTPIGRGVAALFPQSRVLVVQGSGHAVTFNSACAAEYVRDFVQGRSHSACPGIPLELAPLRSFPQAPAGSGKLSAGQTFAIAVSTLREAQATTLTADELGAPVTGMTAGTLLAHQDDTARLDGYADISGVTLTGSLSIDSNGTRGASATIDVGGSRAASGRLELSNGVLAGDLAGVHESAKL